MVMDPGTYSWLDPRHPKAPSTCFLPKRHRGFLRHQLVALPIWDNIMKEMKSLCEDGQYPLLHFDPETGHSQWQCECHDRNSPVASPTSSSPFHCCPCFLEGQLHGQEYRRHSGGGGRRRSSGGSSSSSGVDCGRAGSSSSFTPPTSPFGSRMKLMSNIRSASEYTVRSKNNHNLEISRRRRDSDSDYYGSFDLIIDDHHNIWT